MPDVQWFTDRAKECHVSIAQISKVITDTGQKDLVGRALNNERWLKPHEILGLANQLRVPIGVIFERLGYEVAGAMVPLIGRVSEFGRIMPYGPELTKEVPAPSDLSRKLVAVEVDAPGSKLGAWHGVHLFYEPATAVRLNAIGRLSVIELGEHTAPIVGTVDSTAGRGTVIVLGGIERIESNQIKSATPVLWTHAT